MKKNKKIIISITLFLLIVGLSVLLFNTYEYQEEKGDLIENKDMFSIYLETEDGSNIYVESDLTNWPLDYIYNSDKSYCTYGSTMSWSGTGIDVNLNGADQCFVYFKFPPDLNIATFTLDGEAISAYPAKADNIAVDVNCTNGYGKWHYDDWYLSVDDFEGKPNCTVEFTTVTPKALNNYIIEDLYAGTDGNEDIYKTNNAEYRYTGKFPNNYVWYNDELWRIIGVFDSNSHGRAGENLVKIIRDDSLPSLAWDTDDDNSWKDTGSASLSTMLNDFYYNGTNGSSNAGCRTVSTSVPTDCDYTLTGLDAEARSMVQSVTWYLGAHSTQSVSASAMYGYERSTTVSSGSSATTTANIGLMYASDYGYAAQYSCWNGNTNLSSYNTATCGGTNWLLKNQNEWTITAHSDYKYYVFYVRNNGSVSNLGYAYNGYAPRPSLYLNSSVERVAGTGTKADPFIIR